ncbi:MAG: hypothetical protein C0469_14020, partial [Cyanobacteria bacterium DS2.3.42]|nr:hypothetical protein [Cyanobacteria bacterium DS2.3.42]
MTQEMIQVVTPEEKFAIDDVIGNGWQITKQRFWPLLAILGVNGLVAALVPMASFVMGFGGAKDNISLQLLLGLASAVIAFTIEIGMMNVFLMALDGKKINADDCFRCIKYLPTYFVAALLSRSAIALGYLCFIVPGIILQISFQFAGYFIVEKQLGPIAALKASWAICDGARWQLVLLSIVSYFIHVFGILCFIVGGIPAYMVNSLANAATYRSLLAKTPQLAHLMPPPPPPQLSEEAVIELLEHDSWPEHLKPEAGTKAVAAPESSTAAVNTSAAETSTTETSTTETSVTETP